MNRKVLVMAVALMAVTMLATPVMAAPNPNAWRTVPAALASNQPVTYAELTDYCVNVWGLSGNPYPAPPTPTEELVFPYLYIHDASAYYVFTLSIGDDVYEGVSCNVQEVKINVLTMELWLNSNAIWFLGDWGKTNARMNQGFAGTVDLHILDYDAGPPPTWTYLWGEFNLEGFQRFNHQSLYMDGGTPHPIAGTCTTLGNREMM